MSKHIVNWLQTYFRLQAFRNGEALITCPSCGKNKLYFNVNKKIGYCHYASCQYHLQAVTLQKLINVCGFAPDERVIIQPVHVFNVTTSPPAPVDLPKEARPILIKSNNKFLTEFPIALEKVHTDRHLIYTEIYRYNLHFDGMRVYIPVYYEGKMVQWVGRAAWWFENDEIKYKYATGSPVGNFLFNWDKNKKANKITLVENTFVAIVADSVSDQMGITQRYCSTFGSNISESQTKLLGYSKAETVLLVFDQDATDKAVRCVQKLRGLGIRAGSITLARKQPDDYTFTTLTRSTEVAHEIMLKEGHKWFKMDEAGALSVVQS